MVSGPGAGRIATGQSPRSDTLDSTANINSAELDFTSSVPSPSLLGTANTGRTRGTGRAASAGHRGDWRRYGRTNHEGGYRRNGPRSGALEIYPSLAHPGGGRARRDTVDYLTGIGPTQRRAPRGHRWTRPDYPRDVPLLNDFNIAVFRKRDASTGEPCRFRGRFANPQWMSPEQQERPSDGLSSGVLDEAIDVCALGNILYKIAVGRSPWKHDLGDKINTPEIKGKIERAKIRGGKPRVPPYVRETAGPGVKSVLAAMERCYRNDPSKRPTAGELAAYLRGELGRIDDE